jgi:hypothetical protein
MVAIIGIVLAVLAFFFYDEYDTGFFKDNYQIESIITISFFELSYWRICFMLHLYPVFSSYFETKYHLNIFLLMPTTMHRLSTICVQ